jgi:hypothetical protein
MDFKLLHANFIHHLRAQLEGVTAAMLEIIIRDPEKRIRWRVKLPGAPMIDIRIEVVQDETKPGFKRLANPGGPPRGPYR